MPSKSVVVGSAVGLHARPAAIIAEKAGELGSDVTINGVDASSSLMKVSLFLASFSGFYFTVSAVTDDTYRRQFFSVVESQLERAVGMRAVYLATRERR